MIKLGKLSDIYDFQYGKGNNNPDNGGVYPVYGSNGIIGGYDKFNSEDAPVIGHIGANAGSVVFAKGKHFVTYNGVICKIKDCADKMYGYYALLTSNLKQIAFGSAQPFVSYNSLDRIAVYLPPVETQQKISTILCSYDNLIENNNRRIALLEKAAQELYKEWFVRFRFPGYENTQFENGIPKGWEYVKLGEYANISTGKCNREDAEEDGMYPLFDRSQEIKKSSVWLKDCEAIIVPGEGTSFIPRYYKGKFNLHQRCYCVEPKTSKTGKFLFYTIMLNRIYFLYVATGATVPSLRQNNFTNMKIIMPKMELVNKYDGIVSSFIDEINSLKEKNENLIKQRNLLLPRLMSGKLEV